MSKRAAYTVRAVRAGAWWAIEVPEVEGTFTQARRLDQVEAVAREAIALMLDVPEDSFDLELDVTVPDAWAEVVAELQRTQEVARTAVEAASAQLRSVAKVLHGSGLPVRDVGSIMKVSPQRVSQLIND